jgi:hypothetical protein
MPQRIAHPANASVFGIVSVQAAGADTELLRLYAAYLEAEARDNKAYTAWDEAKAEAEASTRLAPVLIWPTVISGSGTYAAQPDYDNPVMDRAAIEDLVAKFPEEKQEFERERRLKALEEWNSECAAANKAFNVDELKATSDNAQ